jgi:hypothetical protein
MTFDFPLTFLFCGLVSGELPGNVAQSPIDDDARVAVV